MEEENRERPGAKEKCLDGGILYHFDFTHYSDILLLGVFVLVGRSRKAK